MRHGIFFKSSVLYLLFGLISSLSTEVQAQVWGLPCGSSLGGSNALITTATTTGEAVYVPLDYVSSTMGSNYFVMYESDEPLTVIKGKSFDLKLIAKSGGAESQTTIVPDLRTTCAFIYSDWNKDGLFETIGQIGTPTAALTPQGNMDVLHINQTINVPSDAKVGKSRIRVRYTKAKNGTMEVGAMHDITNGLLFDIAVYVMDDKGENDCKIIAKSSSLMSGRVEIVTPPKTNGRFDKDTRVTLQATVIDPDQDFISWTVGGEVVSTQPTYEFLVSQSKMVVANFSSPLPELTLSAPLASTEAEPIWYQIMNAQTDSRKDMCISNDGATFKCLKPADGSTQFLWRIETVSGNKVKFISKKDTRFIAVTGSSVQVASSGTPAEFVLALSGNANGSYSVKLNNDGTQLLNCDGSTNNLLIYNGGVGTGSGWHFYKATFSPSTSVVEPSANRPFVFIKDRMLNIQNGAPRSQVRIFDLAGKCLQTEPIQEGRTTIDFPHPKGCYLVELQSIEGLIQIFKTINL